MVVRRFARFRTNLGNLCICFNYNSVYESSVSGEMKGTEKYFNVVLMVVCLNFHLFSFVIFLSCYICVLCKLCKKHIRELHEF